jgi:hypothetical protein
MTDRWTAGEYEFMMRFLTGLCGMTEEEAERYIVAGFEKKRREDTRNP